MQIALNPRFQRSLIASAILPRLSLRKMSSTGHRDKVRVAVCQMTSTPNKSENLAMATELIDESQREGAKVGG